MYTKEVDFSEIEEIRFECQADCGRCCYYQAPALTTSEINRILAHLKAKPRQEFENFALDCLTFQDLLGQLTPESLNEYVDGLMWFWSPFQLEKAEEGFLVSNYTIHFMPTTGRCKLLNPIDQKCFVYPARPDTCQLYPFTQKTGSDGAAKIVLGMQNCPGITSGPTNLNRVEIAQLIGRGLDEAREDILAYEKYIGDNKIKRLAVKRRKRQKPKDVDQTLWELDQRWRDIYFFGKKQRVNFEGKKIIEPFVELGIIPKHPLLALWNEQLVSRKTRHSSRV